MGFSGRWIRSRPLNSVDEQSIWLHLSLTHFLVFAKNREGTIGTGSGVCLCCDLLWLGQHRSFLILLSQRHAITEPQRRAPLEVCSPPSYPDKGQR